MILNKQTRKIFIFIWTVVVSSICFLDEMYVLNYRNLFIEITKEIPARYAGTAEIIKTDATLKCSRSRYAPVYRSQKSLYGEIVKEIDKYIESQKLQFTQKCILRYLVDILKKAHKYVNDILDIKARWADCNITNDQANTQFQTLWNNLFYLFNKKGTPKKVYEKEEKMHDLPTDNENHLCVANTPYLFCEIVHYFLFRFLVVRSSEDKMFYRLKKKIDLSKVMNEIITIWQDSLKDICIEPEKIDYLQEIDKDPEFDKIITEESPPQESKQTKE